MPAFTRRIQLEIILQADGVKVGMHLVEVNGAHTQHEADLVFAHRLQERRTCFMNRCIPSNPFDLHQTIAMAGSQFIRFPNVRLIPGVPGSRPSKQTGFHPILGSGSRMHWMPNGLAEPI